MTMAQTLPAMTAEEALQTVANVRTYREHLTARAAGIVWMVWGLALSFHAFAALFVESPGLGGDVVDGGPGLMANAWAMELAILVVMVAVAGALTNAVWRGLALEAERDHPAWVPYVAGLLVVLSLGAVVFLTNAAGRFGPDGIAFAPLALLASVGAIAIATLQRRRVPVIPGLLGALVLANLFAFGRFLAFDQGHDTQSWGAGVMALSAVVVYSAVGLWTMRKARPATWTATPSGSRKRACWKPARPCCAAASRHGTASRRRGPPP